MRVRTPRGPDGPATRPQHSNRAPPPHRTGHLVPRCSRRRACAGRPRVSGKHAHRHPHPRHHATCMRVPHSSRQLRNWRSTGGQYPAGKPLPARHGTPLYVMEDIHPMHGVLAIAITHCDKRQVDCRRDYDCRRVGEICFAESDAHCAFRVLSEHTYSMGEVAQRDRQCVRHCP